ncbi:histone-like nucleoid-structuring protein, MvaT/MvaU family [Wenzhouxiangella sp. XN24]|uniref:histone-like nucleoid-structuring protein, MvaT/MvaU family n=1 Tax=Wenzhouxiangella sp. XN24 TaxID=2713569 RepID=UPI0013EC0F32|nr:histone-like nucleoid-structuring protein, MvaT/MvaU family [Wenzhouxiangella sp. XN24]NGX17003.1 DNA binding protein [Wenzhouxiangella sp. XN24]
MSAKLKELRNKEALLAKLTEELKALENDKELKSDIKLRDEIEALLKKHGRPVSHLAVLFDLRPAPARGRKRAGAKAAKAPVRKRRRRKLKVYLNPHTGEKVETRGGNHRVLKAWKAEHGSEVVESWVAGE